MKSPSDFRVDAYLPSVLLRDLVDHDRAPSAFLLYFYLSWQTFGHRRAHAALSLEDLATATGLARRTIQGARRLLVRRRLITVTRAARTATPVYRVLQPWIRPR